MEKLLIADTADVFVQAVSKNLRDKFEIYKCADGAKLLSMVQKIQPDVILLDLHLPVMNGLEVLRTLRSNGNGIPVVVTGFLQNDWICNQLAQLQVTQFFQKPCNVGGVASCLLDIATSKSGRAVASSPESVANHMLLNLGFRMGLARYQCVYQALMLKFDGEWGGVTKCLYPKVAKMCGGNIQQVEKAIRDAVKDAFMQGNPAVWQMYFPAENAHCPSNEVFLARLAFAMQEYFGDTPQMKAQ